MTVPGNLSSPLLATAAAAAAAAGPIKSLRFNQDDSANLSRSVSSSSNRRTWTFSCWLKKSELYSSGGYQDIIASGNTTAIGFDSIDKLRVYESVGGTVEASTARMRDLSAWYHIVVKYDTTQATATDRVFIYLNGVDITNKGASYPAQNYESSFNLNQTHYIGRNSGGNYLAGYLADCYLIDGSALDPTSFGGFDDNGVWQAAAYSGTFGTNGFHLFDFANESTIGHDSSGNENDFTANNITPATIDYASGLTTSGGAASGYAASKVFDSNTNNFFLTSGSGTGTTWTFTPPSSISATSLVIRVSQGAKYRVNGGSYTTFSGGSSGELTLTSSITGGAITSIEGYSLGNYQIGLWYIKVNGSILTSDQGASTDVLFDVPVNGTQSDTGAGGEVSGNYPTFNPLMYQSTSAMTNGNLDIAPGGGSYGTAETTVGVSSGAWYWEVTVNTATTSAFIGIRKPTDSLSTFVGNTANSYAYSSSNKWNNGNNVSYGASFGAGDVIGVALDLDNGNLVFYKNGSSQGTAYTGLSGTFMPAISEGGGGNVTLSINFGQRAFANNAPANHKCINTTNLPTPTVADGSDYFDTALWTGNGSSKTISGLGFSPDFVWMKNRSFGTDPELYDTIRGAENVIKSNRTDAEGADSSGLLSFTSDGWTLGSSGALNRNNDAIVGWTWDAGSSNASNSSGSITSTVRANIAAGFSIVKWTGTSSAATIGHGLGASLGMYIIKNTDDTTNWAVYHKSVGATKKLQLNSTAAASSSSFFNSTEPTTSVFSVGGSGTVNNSGDESIAYCFAPVAGFSAFGGPYNGTGSDTSTPFQYCGFRPAWILIKSDSSAEDWVIYDTARGPENVVDNVLRPNRDNVEATADERKIDILSNGFKFRGSEGSINAASKSYVWWAIAENPFQANGGLAR